MPPIKQYKQVIHVGLLINACLLLFIGAGYSQHDTLTIKDSTVINLPQKKESKSKLDAQVKYAAADSMIFNLEQKKVYLYGQATVDYEVTKLKAGYIELDLEKNEVFAIGKLDSLGKTIEKPVFEDAGKTFTSKQMRYNFKTKKGKINEVITQEGEGFIHGENVKMVSEDVIFIKNGKYTTCNAEKPHFHIQATKLKVIKNDKIITGPACLVIADIPTPLMVPFGFFPNKKGKASGLIIPTYGQSSTLGYYLNKGGYYFSINDRVDLGLTADIYTRGSWGLAANSNYKTRYKYSGNLNVSYSQFKQGDKDFGTFSQRNNFFVRWKHTQDSKARPNSRFSADVNAGTVSNFQTNFNSSNRDYLSNQFKSNINYNRSWRGKPYNLTLNASQTQNSLDSTVNITLPEAVFTANRMFPFKRKSKIGSDKWYEKIGFSYTGNLKNQLNTHQNQLFNDTKYSDLKNGIRHTIPISTSIKILKYLTLTPNASYTEKWYLQSINKTFDGATNQVITDTLQHFQSTRDLNFRAAFTTKIYGMYQFRSKKILGVRHIFTPSVNASFKPDFSGGAYKTVQVDSLGNTQQYTIFQNALFGGPSRGKTGLIGFSMQNNLEMKIRSHSDTITGTKKIKIFEGLNFNSNYNVFADSMNWSNITIRAWTKIFKNVNIQFNGTMDPYALDAEGRRINVSEYKRNNHLGRLTRATTAISFNLRSKNRVSQPKTSKFGTQEELDMINSNPNAYVDFNIPWTINVRYNMNYSKPGLTKKLTSSIMFSGDVNITKKWKVGYSTGYDFVAKKATFTSLEIYRDLHCWELKFNVVPFGNRKSYSVNLNVKSSILQDLKLSRRRTWYN